MKEEIEFVDERSSLSPVEIEPAIKIQVNIIDLKLIWQIQYLWDKAYLQSKLGKDFYNSQPT